jgi:hypothetical protein
MIKLLRHYLRHHSDFVKKYSDKKSDIRKRFKKDKMFFLGSLNILDSLKSIFERHGRPKIKVIPKRIDLYIAHPTSLPSPFIGKESLGYFGLEDGHYSITKVTNDPFVLDVNNNLGIIIAHEIQHFVKSLYSREKEYDFQSKEFIGGYFGKPGEIQAYALMIAKNAVDLLKEMYAVRTEGKGAEFIDRVLDKMEQTQNDITKTYLARSVLKFFTLKEEKYSGEFTDEIKKKYYRSAWHNFTVLFNQFINNERQKLSMVTSDIKNNWYKKANENIIEDGR